MRIFGKPQYNDAYFKCAFFLWSCVIQYYKVKFILTRLLRNSVIFAKDPVFHLVSQVINLGKVPSFSQSGATFLPVQLI